MGASEVEAVTFFKNLISQCNYPISFLFIQLQIESSSPNVQAFMNEKYAGDDLYDFFYEHSNIFRISKLGVVSLATSIGHNASKPKEKMKRRNIEIEKKAATYFENVIRTTFHGAVVNVSCLYDHIKRASGDVIKYLNDMYPGETFDLFFHRFPDIFSIDKGLNISFVTKKGFFETSAAVLHTAINEFVTAETGIEKRAVDYFRSVLMSRYDEPTIHTYLHGHLSQATYDVREYIKDKYPADQFLSFFLDHPAVFKVDSLGNISLHGKHYPVIADAVQYIRDVLIQRYDGPIHYTRLQGHVQQAPFQKVKDFLNDCYPGKNFELFLRENSNDFYVDARGFVRLR